MEPEISSWSVFFLSFYPSISLKKKRENPSNISPEPLSCGQDQLNLIFTSSLWAKHFELEAFSQQMRRQSKE